MLNKEELEGIATHIETLISEKTNGKAEWTYAYTITETDTIVSFFPKNPVSGSGQSSSPKCPLCHKPLP